MNRRVLLSSVGSLLLIPISGCVANPSTSKDVPPITEQFNCEDATRPEPNVPKGVEHEAEIRGNTTTYTSVGSTEYPSAPTEFDEGTLRNYVKLHENAYQHNKLVERSRDKVIELNVRTGTTEILNSSGNLTIIALDFSVHSAIVGDGGVSTTEPAEMLAVYAIDKTGLARTQTYNHNFNNGSSEEERPNPLDGELLVCFEGSR